MEKNLFQAPDEDDFYKIIYFSDLESKIVSTPGFHRLHDIYQGSDVYESNPSNYTKRYERVLGIMKLYRNMMGVYTQYANEETNKENTDVEIANFKIVNEIFNINKSKGGSENKSAIITLSPVNDKVLEYLSENPQAFYQLGDREFEVVMAEIYNKLGYKVELTKTTRDGGKDIILRKPEILGDFIYYVECKKYSPEKPIGVGIIRNLVGTINTDRVNGGILATTSYFTPDAKKFIIDNKYDYQIQMHDYDVIRKLLDQVV